jgi:hypothetical protein
MIASAGIPHGSAVVPMRMRASHVFPVRSMYPCMVIAIQKIGVVAAENRKAAMADV